MKGEKMNNVTVVEIFDNGTVEVSPNRSYTLNPNLSEKDIEDSTPVVRKVFETIRKAGGAASHADLLAAHLKGEDAN